MFKVNKPSSSRNKQTVKIKLPERRKYLRFFDAILNFLEWTRSKPGRCMSRMSAVNFLVICVLFKISIKHYVHTNWWVFNLKVVSTLIDCLNLKGVCSLALSYWNYFTFSFMHDHYLLYVRKISFYYSYDRRSKFALTINSHFVKNQNRANTNTN